MLRAIDALKTFDILYATKGRGGGSNNEVETLNIFAYGESFEYSQYGRASALLILFFLLILVVLVALAPRPQEGKPDLMTTLEAPPGARRPSASARRPGASCCASLTSPHLVCVHAPLVG